MEKIGSKKGYANVNRKDRGRNAEGDEKKTNWNTQKKDLWHDVAASTIRLSRISDQNLVHA
jgi:hypothetical protein